MGSWGGAFTSTQKIWSRLGGGGGGAGFVWLSWDKDGIRATSGAHALLGEGKLTLCSSYFLKRGVRKQRRGVFDPT